MNSFTLIPANRFIWNRSEFIQFLIDNQGKSIEISTKQEGVCLRTAGVYELLERFGYEDVLIKTNNAIENHSRYTIEFVNPFSFFKIKHASYTDLHRWNQQTLFGCFYNRPLWHRLGLASVLQHDHSDRSTINIRSSIADIDERDLFEIHELFKNHPESFKKFASVASSWPIQLEDVDGYTNGNDTTGHTDQLCDFYVNFLVDIVAETWIDGDTFFLTEKTIRPMLLKKPMLLMCSRNCIEYLLQMGFQSFHEFWDETYDGFEGRDRYMKILKIIDDLSKKSMDELSAMYRDMQPILDHNYNLLQTQNYKKTIRKICDEV